MRTLNPPKKAISPESGTRKFAQGTPLLLAKPIVWGVK